MAIIDRGPRPVLRWGCKVVNRPSKFSAGLVSGKDKLEEIFLLHILLMKFAIWFSPG